MTYRSRHPFLTLLRHKAKHLPYFSAKAYQTWRHEGFVALGSKIKESLRAAHVDADYCRWIEQYDTLTDSDRTGIRCRIDQFIYRPLISVVLPVYDVEERWLRFALESVRRQLYQHWELCIADDHSPSPHVRRVLDEYVRADPRIKVVFRDKNGHISAASNTALRLATGEFIALLDHDDELAEHALYLVAEEINAYPEVDLIYTDEDKLTQQGGRCKPFFKSDWNPDRLYSLNAISHLGVYRASIVREIGGFREGYEGSQDYDLALRVIERIPKDHIRHLPYALYHWRELEGSVALDARAKEYAHEAARKAIRSHLNRVGIDATVRPGYLSFHRVIYPLTNPPLVSLIITVLDQQSSLPLLVKNILAKTNYKPLELLVVYNQNESIDLSGLKKSASDYRVELLPFDDAMNSAELRNFAITHARGEVVGFIGSVRPLSSDWLTEMVSHALRPTIGAVGAKIYGRDGSIHHAGVILGLNETAGCAYRNLPRHQAEKNARAQIIQNYSAVSGDCLVCRREVFQAMGGFDGVHFPVTYHDVDYCLRLRQNGYQILWTPYAEVRYVDSAVCRLEKNEEDPAQRKREEAEFKSRWNSLIKSDACYSPNLTLERANFSVAFPPRVTPPWKLESNEQPTR
jgi:GT2 family glycosyltransferase